VQFNDVPVEWWREERVRASDDEKKFLTGMVTADRNRGARQETLLTSLGNSSNAYILPREAVPDYNVPK
jgi:hypothetical protein